MAETFAYLLEGAGNAFEDLEGVVARLVLYGPIEEASYVFPTVALVDAAFAQLSMEEGRRPGAGHPIFRIP